MPIELVIEGKVVPYVRMTQRSKFANPQAQRYLSFKQDAGMQLLIGMQRCEAEIFQNHRPLSVSITFEMTGALHKADLDNMVKGVMDSGNKIVWEDDRYVDEINAKRWSGPVDITIIRVSEL